MLGTVIGTGDMVISRTDKKPTLLGLIFILKLKSQRNIKWITKPVKYKHTS